MTGKTTTTPPTCSFCGKSNAMVKWLIAGPDHVMICDECADLTAEIVDEKTAEPRAEAVARVCELSLQLANDAISLSQRLEYQEDLDEQAILARPRRRPRPGEDIAGASLIRVLGAGNFGTVWQASRRSDGEPCAVKIFDPDKVAIGLMLWRFQRGIRAMQHLTGLPEPKPESVCAIDEVSSDRLAFSMPYLPGGDLSTLRRLGWSARKKHEAFLKIADAVGFAHRNGIVHRDIKPANIVLDRQLEPVLTDFDIADLVFAGTQSMAAASLGTPTFAAPEQLEGQLLSAPTADVFSLGKVLAYLITETAPPMGATFSGDGAHNSHLLAGVHGPAMREIIARCLQMDPDARFQSVDELLDRLPGSIES